MDGLQELAFGDEVAFPWGFGDDARGTVEEIYGPPGRLFVLIRLSREVSGEIVDEPTTVSMPMSEVRKTA